MRNSCLKLFIQALENLQFVSLPLFYLGKFILSFIFKFLSVFNISKQVEYFIKFYLQYEMTWTRNTLLMSLLYRTITRKTQSLNWNINTVSIWMKITKKDHNFHISQRKISCGHFIGEFVEFSKMVFLSETSPYFSTLWRL